MDDALLTINGRPYRAPAYASFPVVNPRNGERPYIAVTAVNVAAEPMIPGDREVVITMNLVAPPAQMWSQNGGCYRPDEEVALAATPGLEEETAVSWQDDEEQVDRVQPQPTVAAVVICASLLVCGILIGLLIANW